MRAKVIFTDGFFTSPFIETKQAGLWERIRIAAGASPNPSEAATTFICLCHEVDMDSTATIHNTPEGRTFGGTVATIENPGFWPGDGNQAGVFLVNLETRVVSYWGGKGFEDSEEFTPPIVQRRELPDEGKSENQSA